MTVTNITTAANRRAANGLSGVSAARAHRFATA